MLLQRKMDSLRWGLGLFTLLDDLHREREREVGTLLWMPWTRQVMKNVVPSCPFITPKL